MSVVNLGEVYFMLYKKNLPARAQAVWRSVPRYPIKLYEVDQHRMFEAAKLKAVFSTSKMPISYADCYAAALAQELNATLITGDPEFQVLSHLINIQFLPR